MNRLRWRIERFVIQIKYGVHPKPSYILRLMRNLILAKVFRRIPLRGIDFAITYACNFNCEHCYAKKLLNPKRRKLLPEDYKRIRNEATKLGAVTFSLQGGEPLVANNLEKIILALRPKKNHIVITTNCSLITEPKVIQLRSLGVDTICVSLDSGIREEHDKFRKKPGNFTKVMKTIELCEKYHMKVVINTCVTTKSLYEKGLQELLYFAKKHRILVEVMFPRPLGNWEQREELLLTQKDYLYYKELEREYPFVARDLSNNYFKYGCPALKEYFYITEYGDVCPCPFTHIALGNIFDEPLKTIRDRGLSIDWWGRYYPECLTACNKEFMAHYYPLIQKKPLISLEEFMG